MSMRYVQGDFKNKSAEWQHLLKSKEYNGVKFYKAHIPSVKPCRDAALHYVQEITNNPFN